MKLGHFKQVLAVLARPTSAFLVQIGRFLQQVFAAAKTNAGSEIGKHRRSPFHNVQQGQGSRDAHAGPSGVVAYGDCRQRSVDAGNDCFDERSS
ncbi:hypothetical protein AF72_05150 [Xylella taiwanensis]|uniref:Uncharacterized protein n=1 Tax=Xylella taiwanensis TaxID=1444770 RepID=Z9JJ88_9GAMM|nr:hypothetical protein AB672_02480 [Xylella taiwanensis]EWS78465.1 hypothetical protein AF72_05150 [Xylella taiwanensis]